MGNTTAISNNQWYKLTFKCDSDLANLIDKSYWLLVNIFGMILSVSNKETIIKITTEILEHEIRFKFIDMLQIE